MAENRSTTYRGKKGENLTTEEILAKYIKINFSNEMIEDILYWLRRLKKAVDKKEKKEV